MATLFSRLAVEPHPTEPATFIPRNPTIWLPPGVRSAYGGLIIGLALQSARRTVPAHLGLQSTHCYFLRPGVPGHEMKYVVSTLQDGKAFMRREVKGWQKGKLFFVLMASFTVAPEVLPERVFKRGDVRKEEETPSKVSNSLTDMSQPWDEDPSGRNGEGRRVKEGFQVPFPGDILLPYDQCESNESFIARRLEANWDIPQWKRDFLTTWIEQRATSPFQSAVARLKPGVTCPPEFFVDGNAATRMTWNWPTTTADEVIDEEAFKAMIAFTSDYQLVGATTRAMGINMSTTPHITMIASLDHSVHYYPFPPDLDYRKPTLHVMEAQVGDFSTARATARGRVYSHDGVLLAVTCQEGAIAWKGDGEPRRGLAASGVDEEDLMAKL
ncbi:acyl-CoA thioesterase II [Cryptococcus floricola]|uniref:Acyl-CoA thioesterase II n=1 Tax=Cryptococcus floricola TaxID=2591691 RepID=A0A5D3ANZ4_9TREE|nr:acyl-CoA thioesterase II [Cryptococcus floricola]